MNKILKLKLIKPNRELRQAFLTMQKDFKESKEDRYQNITFGQYLKEAENEEKGINLKPGYCCASIFWLINEKNEILGVSSLRHKLVSTLRRVGGHIGYNVPPSKRKKGYGTLLLKLTLQKAKKMGFKKVLLTCNKDNIGSAKIIQKNGGVFKNEMIDPATGNLKQRYWIKISENNNAKK